MDKALRRHDPDLQQEGDGRRDGVGLAGGLSSSLVGGAGRTWLEIVVIILVAVIIIGGAEFLLDCLQGAAIRPAEAEPDRRRRSSPSGRSSGRIS